jgi:asparagine synthase (glutamine-hydrolysing)
MPDQQQQSICYDTAAYKLLTRGAYSSSPLYFYERPVATPTGNKWLVTHSLREIGSYLNNRPSPEGVRDYLCYGFVPAPRTIFKGVLAVPPNTSCRLSNIDGSITWHTNQNITIPALSNPEQAFWQQLSSYCELTQANLLLSGGLDSAMVAAAAITAGTKISAYHGRFRGVDTGEGSDTHAARLTAQHLGLNYKEITIDSLDALRFFDKTIAALDQPLGDPVILPFYLLFNAIKQKQQPVLTGEGGDQLFGSWSMRPMLMRELYPETGYRREQGYLASFHKFRDEWAELISAKLGQQLDSSACLDAPIQRAFASSPSADFCNQLRWVDLQLKGLQHIKPRIDAMATAHDLILQHPFFQADMIATSIALPNELKMAGAVDKVLLKQLARSYLPASVIDRRKQGMGVPTSLWFKRGLMLTAAHWLNKNRLIQSGLLNPDTVQEIRRQNIKASDGRGRRWGDRLWMLCALECWFASLT